MEEKNAKEINLLQLLSMIFDWFAALIKKLINFIGLTLQLAVKYWLFVLIILILSISVGLYLSRSSVAKYKAGAVMLLYGSDLSTTKEVCRQLQNSIASNKSYSLANKLGVPDSVAKNIVLISNYNVIDYLKDGTPDAVDFKRNHSLTDTLNLVMNDRIYLQIITKSISQLPVVQEALLKYFNDNPMMQRDFENGKQNLQDRINLCDKEIRRLDSLAKVSYFKDEGKKIAFENNQLIVGEQKKQLFYDDILKLQDIKSETKNTLVNFRQPVDLPSGLVINAVPVNNPIKYGILSFIFGALISILFVFIADNFKKIINYLSSKK